MSDLFQQNAFMYLNNKIFLGDNIKILPTLPKSEIDFIYIDPPYNTNNKFSYNDSNNTWAQDIASRLSLAKTLLKTSGIICISIDDNELANLLQVCFKIFEKKNYVGTFITRQAQRSNAKYINVTHEYVVVFAKDKTKLQNFYIKRINIPEDRDMINNISSNVLRAFGKKKENAYLILKRLISKYALDKNISWIKNYTNIDNNGKVFFAKDLSTPSAPCTLKIDEINLFLPALKTRGWSSREKFINLYNKNRLCFKGGRPYEIQYLDEAIDNISSVLNFYSRNGTNDLKKLGLDGLFDTPKPVELIKFLIRATMHHDAKILDFYAGSGTTAQAVYEINKEDKTNHSFILIQRKETVSKSSPVYKKLTAMGVLNPTVSDILQIRLETYLKNNNQPIDFEIKEM